MEFHFEFILVRLIARALQQGSRLESRLPGRAGIFGWAAGGERGGAGRDRRCDALERQHALRGVRQHA